MTEVRWSTSLFNFIMKSSQNHEHITWLNAIALWLIKNGEKTHHKELLETFDISYSFSDKVLRQFLNRGLCHRRKRENSRVVDYIFNDALQAYAQYIFETKIKPHINFSWEEYVRGKDVGHPFRPADSCREKVVQRDPDLILRLKV